jgi:hypothetical protein
MISQNRADASDSIDTWMLGIDGGTCGFPGIAAVKAGEPKPAPFLGFYQR